MRVSRFSQYTILIILILVYIGCSENANKEVNTGNVIVDKKAEEYLEKGISRLGNDDYQGALDDFNNALVENPNYPEALMMRGLTRSYIGNHKSALDDYKQILKLNDRYTHTVIPLIAASYIVLGDFEQAYDLCSKEIGNSTYEFEGKYYTEASGLISYMRAIAITNLLNHKNKSNYSSDDDTEYIENALLDFNRALESHTYPENIIIPDTHTGIIIGTEKYESPDEYTSFIVPLGELFRIPNYRVVYGYDLSGIYLHRGRLHQNIGKYEDSIIDFNESIKLKPKNEVAFLERALSKYALEHYSEAIKDYTNALEINPNNDSSYYFRGVSKAQLRDFKNALADFNRAFEINPKNHSALWRRGNIKDELNDNLGAIQDYTNAISIYPRAYAYYHDRGVVYYELDKYKEAIKDFTEAINIAPNIYMAYDARASSKSEVGDYEGALKDYDKAIELAPIDILSRKIYVGRGLTKIKMGDKKGGCQDMSKAGEMEYYEAYDYIKEYCR